MIIGGLDVGTTGCKLTAYDDKGNFIYNSYKEYEVSRHSGEHEFDAAVIFDNSCSCQGMERIRQWSELLERTIQASYSLLINKINHYVYWFDAEQVIGEKKEVRNEQDFHACMSQLLQCKPNKNSQAYINYLMHAEEIGTYANIFYVGDNQELLEKQGISVKVVD